MLQVAQDLRTGTVRVLQVPPPILRPGGLLVRTLASLISTGTERTKVELARSSLLSKVRGRPDALKQVVQAVRREGVSSAYRRVNHRLDQLLPLGYSASGVVTAVARDVTEFHVGNRVAVGGGGYANHAELLWVPQRLASRVPDTVPTEQAAFATVASVALHALRLGRSGLGETVGVIGLGLVGQLIVRMAVAAGCKVVGCDPLRSRVDLAGIPGVSAGDPATLGHRVSAASGGLGADVVLVAATGSSSEAMRLAADVARDRGTIVAVGAIGMDMPRDVLYRKELQVVVSRSYGPGRYDPTYEEGGRDYPVAYVRWTEGRNLGAVLQLLEDGRLDVEPLISRRYPIAGAAEAYDALMRKDPSVVGILLEYPQQEALGSAASNRPRPVQRPRQSASESSIRIGLIGVGSFASNVLLPLFTRNGAKLVAVASASGLTAQDAVRRHGFQRALPSASAVIGDPEVNAVVIATPHHLHADLALEGLQAGKAVFVEKPLATCVDQMERLKEGVSAPDRLFVGFNRRFSPHTVRVRSWLAQRSGAAMIGIRVNAGAIPRDSWVHDREIGGGRLVGEACHFVDLAAALVGQRPIGVSARGVTAPDPDAGLTDNFVITLDFADGSIASIVYTAKGDGRLGKERIEVFADGSCAVIEDFDRTVTYDRGGRKVYRRRGAKGHREEIEAFVAAVRVGEPMPVRAEELFVGAAATLLAHRSLVNGGERLEVAWAP